MLTAKQVANYFLHLVDEDTGDSISNLKLQKLVYYAQGWYLALTGKSLFADRIEAWAHGPVVPTLYHEYRVFGWEPIHEIMWQPAALPRPDDTIEIDEDTASILNEVWEAYGQYSAKRLEEITHSEDPWKNARARRNCGLGDRCDEEITQEEMKVYYTRQVANN